MLIAYIPAVPSVSRVTASPLATQPSAAPQSLPQQASALAPQKTAGKHSSYPVTTKSLAIKFALSLQFPPCAYTVFLTLSELSY